MPNFAGGSGAKTARARESKTQSVDKKVAKKPVKETRPKVLEAMAKKAADKLKTAQRKAEKFTGSAVNGNAQSREQQKIASKPNGKLNKGGARYDNTRDESDYY
jgi:hypothetical protein